MFWIIVLILLLAVIGALLWWRWQQEQEWMMELTYLSRHEDQQSSGDDGQLAGDTVSVLRGVKPNVNDTRAAYRSAEASKAVYEQAVEKVRALSPKMSRKFASVEDKEAASEQHSVNDLPIFAAAEAAETTALPEEVADAPSIRNLKAEPLLPPPLAEAAFETEQAPDAGSEIPASVPPRAEQDIPMFGAVVSPQIQARDHSVQRLRKDIPPAAYVDYGEQEYQPAKVVDPALEVITYEDATRSLKERAQAAQAALTPTLETVDVHNWKPKPALEAETVPPIQPGGQVGAQKVEMDIIDFDDIALARVRERTRIEIKELHQKPALADLPVRETEIALSLETIGEDDIRTNLLRQRMARTRQANAQTPVHGMVPNVIPEDEVLANLAHTDSPINRPRPKIKRVSMRESVIPEAARVDKSHGLILPPRAAESSAPAPISTRFTPYSAVAAGGSNVMPAGVPNDMLMVDIPEPPSFSEPLIAEPEVVIHEQPSLSPQLHVTDKPKWSITDRLISESAPVAEETMLPKPAYQNWQEAAATEKETVLHQMMSRVQAAFAAEGVTALPTPEQPPTPNTAHAFTPPADIPAWVPPAVTQGDDAHLVLPSLNLLVPPQFDHSATQTEDAMLENSITIEEKLAEFKVKVKVMDAYAGPVITRYEIEPDVGVRGNQVMNLEKDLARSLGVASVRVVETIPGKTCMGLELPNPKRQTIRLSEVFNSPAFEQSKSKLTLALGQDITGQPVVTDLAKAPHLLVAGTTGSGKSVGVNSMIISMLFKATPEEVRMIMIDPKMLELSIYEGIPHLLAPVVTDMKLAANALNWCVNEMEKRYRLMSHMGVRNIAGFNQKVKEAEAQGQKLANPFSLTPDNPEPLETLPFIVVVVDEFADLMMTAGKKIEELIARLAQKARAAGIHLILATQRPSVDVITGLIKANIPTRIAFQVSSKVDSRTILDQMGAENLLGQGDMLFLPPGTGYPQRVHGAFVEDGEVHRIVEYLKQFGEPDYVDDILTAGVGSDDMFSNANGGRSNEGDEDPLYDEAVAIVAKTRKATISSVQRQLRIGYNRAARLIDQMEADGIVSAPESNGNRTVLAPTGNHLE